MGLVHEPLFHDLNAFINESQQKVNGKVDLQLWGAAGCSAGHPRRIYSDDLVSFDSTTIDQCHATGVSAYYGIQARLVEEQGKNNG